MAGHHCLGGRGEERGQCCSFFKSHRAAYPRASLFTRIYAGTQDWHRLEFNDVQPPHTDSRMANPACLILPLLATRLRSAALAAAHLFSVAHQARMKRKEAL